MGLTMSECKPCCTLSPGEVAASLGYAWLLMEADLALRPLHCDCVKLPDQFAIMELIDSSSCKWMPP